VGADVEAGEGLVDALEEVLGRAEEALRAGDVEEEGGGEKGRTSNIQHPTFNIQVRCSTRMT
jgi:hypothetical protein